MGESQPAAGARSGKTAWGRSLETPLRQFLRTETGSAAILLGATLLALAWANLFPAGYEQAWRTDLSIHLGGRELALTLRGWVNSGLMSFFFLVAGLEARREFDMGELRERRRLGLPVVAGLGGMIVPIAIYLAFNAGHATARGWGIAMSTDTAFALGMLALAGPRLPDRVRTYLLTFAIVDDIVAIAIIAFVYSGSVTWPPLLVGVLFLAAAYLLRRLGLRSGPVYAVLGVAAWVAFHESGIDPIVVGLLVGLLTVAYPASRSALEQATEVFRRFREQPTPELAQTAREGVRTAISPNDRLQQIYHSWTSYVIVPLFALANAGVVISGELLARAFTSPVTLGILIGYVAGKPAGTVAAAWLLEKLSRGRVQPPIGWGAVTGVGTIAGIGFTVALLIASAAFGGALLEEAKIGILTAALGSSALTWLVFRVTAMLPRRARARALLGTAETIVDLAVPVDENYDHIRGPEKSPVTVVEYGDFECPYCGEAEPVIRELLAGFGDVRYVWRHLPLTDVHPHAQLAAEGSEAAAKQGGFWAMHDELLAHQGALNRRDLIRYAGDIGLDTERFADDLARRAGLPKIARDVDSADQSGVSGTPTFFINGQRHHGAYDIESLSAAVRSARVRAAIAAPAA
ncbi:MAG TPA: Na+/H+ antiporter NhaA [Streptosporangiaceae bacterium]|nr:Na+/H+ antiporter NhaA [Streptosporangiaceae bacterium]